MTDPELWKLCIPRRPTRPPGATPQNTRIRRIDPRTVETLLSEPPNIYLEALPHTATRHQRLVIYWGYSPSERRAGVLALTGNSWTRSTLKLDAMEVTSDLNDDLAREAIAWHLERSAQAILQRPREGLMLSDLAHLRHLADKESQWLEYTNPVYWMLEHRIKRCRHLKITGNRSKTHVSVDWIEASGPAHLADAWVPEHDNPEGFEWLPSLLNIYLWFARLRKQEVEQITIATYEPDHNGKIPLVFYFLSKASTNGCLLVPRGSTTYKILLEERLLRSTRKELKGFVKEQLYNWHLAHPMPPPLGLRPEWVFNDSIP